MMRKAMLGDTATLSLDFTTGTKPSAVTFTRADSTARATFIDASGYVKTVVSAGDPRFDYHPVSLAARGLLVENNVTNYVLQSQGLSGTGWAAYGLIAVSIDGTVTDPMGGTDAKIIAASSGTAFHGLVRYQVAGSATTVTVSIFAKKNNYKYLYMTDVITNVIAVRFNLETGVADLPVASGGTGYVSSKMTPHRNGWYRCQMTANIPSGVNRGWGFAGVPDSGATYAITGATYNGQGNSSDGIYAIGLQVEEGTTASSYIPTTTAALTRLADDAVIRSTAWTGLYSKPGTIVVEYYRGEYGAGDRSVLAIDTAATKHIHLKHANASAASGIYDSAGSGVANKIAGNVTGLNKAAFNWSSGNPSTIKYALNGNATVVSGSSDIGATLGTWMTIGSASTTGVSGSGTWEGYLNNSIKSVKYYSELLSDADMIAKTT
jgi:hypothetical protein